MVHTLTIDGADVAGAAGQSILEVAAENGVAIPTLCHLEGLSDVGAGCAWSRSAGRASSCQPV
jgi:bidirectional [NiFe] hydrogenase diaphorase subunit